MNAPRPPDDRQVPRRQFVKALYVAPVILTLVAAPAFAKAGSDKVKPKPEKPGKPGKP